MNEVLGQAVAIGSIGVELKKLWEADEAATNATLMNLAIYSEKEGALEENSEAIVSLTREHACRAILVELQVEHPTKSIEAWVTAHCHLAHGRKTVCCEQLSFRLKGRVLGRMRNTLFANLNSDLPLVFWWQGDLSRVFEERLYRITDRMIVDAADWTDVPAGFQRLQQAVTDSRCQMAVQDLAWTRTYQLRLGIAGLFDDPVAQEMLLEAEEVQIVAQSQHWVSAWMLVAWVATQAGWTYTSGEGGSFFFQRADGQPVQMSWQSVDEGAPVGSISISGGSTSVTVSRERGDSHLALELSSPSHSVKRIAPADPIDTVDLVAEQLSRGGKNSLFRKIWPTFFTMLGIEVIPGC